MKPQTEEKPPLSPQWAFVLQFRAGANIAQGYCEGRIEHVVSGHATHFQSVEELLTFITKILDSVRTQSSDES
jgi:hypothetical protein